MDDRRKREMKRDMGRERKNKNTEGLSSDMQKSGSVWGKNSGFGKRNMREKTDGQGGKRAGQGEEGRGQRQAAQGEKRIAQGGEGREERGTMQRGKCSVQGKEDKARRWAAQKEKHAAQGEEGRAQRQAVQRDKRCAQGKRDMQIDKITQERNCGQQKNSVRQRRAVREEGKIAGAACPVYKKCGACQYLHLTYEKQLARKRELLNGLLKGICPVKDIIGMENPYHYRNKVHAVFGHDRRGNAVSGVYREGTHELVPVEWCLIEDEKADEVIGTIRSMLRSFKIRTFDEDTGYGLLRHVLVKRGFATGEMMVVLVTASPVFPSKNNFVKALREKYPEITTIIQNINGRNTSMVLGEREHVLYGKGYIEDVLCGYRFRISSKSFYQVNPVQTEKLYRKAMELAGLTGTETVLDAYCGIGTIGITASGLAGRVIGVELNRDAVKDAVQNAKRNGIGNIEFYCNDAGRFMSQMAAKGEKPDVVFMDPPRSGSTEEFIEAVAQAGPRTVVYISCGPETLARDLRMFEKKGYRTKEAWGVDMFPWTGHCETVCLLSRIK